MATSRTGRNPFKAITAIIVILAAVAIGIWQYQRINQRYSYNPNRDEVVGVRLAQEITALVPSGPIVVVAYRSEEQLDDVSQAVLRGFKRSLKEKRDLQYVSVEEVAGRLFGGQDLAPILEGGMPPQVFDTIVREHADAPALVSLAGLPPRYAHPAYNPTQRPKIGVADVLLLSQNAWMSCLHQNFIDFIILPRLDPGTERASDEDKVFAQNFHFVTKENLPEVAAEYQ